MENNNIFFEICSQPLKKIIVDQSNIQLPNFIIHLLNTNNTCSQRLYQKFFSTSLVSDLYSMKQNISFNFTHFFESEYDNYKNNFSLIFFINTSEIILYFLKYNNIIKDIFLKNFTKSKKDILYYCYNYSHYSMEYLFCSNCECSSNIKLYTKTLFVNNKYYYLLEPLCFECQNIKNFIPIFNEDNFTKIKINADNLKSYFSKKNISNLKYEIILTILGMNDFDRNLFFSQYLNNPNMELEIYKDLLLLGPIEKDIIITSFNKVFMRLNENVNASN